MKNYLYSSCSDGIFISEELIRCKMLIVFSETKSEKKKKLKLERILNVNDNEK